MKLNNIKQTVVEHGKYKSPEADLILPSNICPECGHDITENNKKFYHKYYTEKENIFGKYSGVEVEFSCPECRCTFIRTVYTEYEPEDIGVMVPLLIILFLLLILFVVSACITCDVDTAKIFYVFLLLSIMDGFAFLGLLVIFCVI